MRVNLKFFLLAALLLGACGFDPAVMRQRYVKSGNKYFERGRFKEAALLYRHALDEDMRYGEAWYRMGLVNLKLGQDDAARGNFSRAVDLDPDNMDAMVHLAEMDIAIYSLDPERFKLVKSEVQELIGKMLLKNPGSYDALRLSGYLASMRGNFRLAAAKFREASQARPNDDAVALALVQVLLANGEPAEALRLAAALIARSPGYGPVYDLLYGVYMQSGQPAKAEDILRQKIRNNPAAGPYWIQLAEYFRVVNRIPDMVGILNHLTADPRTFPNCHLLVGDYFVRIRDFDRAIREYYQGTKDDSAESAVYLRKMAQLLVGLGRNRDAANVVQALLKLEPSDPEALAMHIALELPGAGKDKARSVIAEIQPILERQPDNFELHYYLGRAYQIAGDASSLEEARTQFEETLRLRPDYVAADLALMHIQLNAGENSKVVLTAQQVLAGDSANLEAHLAAATAYARMGDLDHAQQELETALRSNPSDREARLQMAELKLRRRDYRDAGAQFKALNDLGDPRGALGLARVLYAVGNYQTAIQVATGVLAKIPGRDDFRLLLAQSDFEAGRFADSVAQYAVLAAKNPKTADFYVQIGRAKWALNDVNGALAAFNEAHRLNPGDPAPFLELAALQAEAGDNPSARKSYGEALKLQPDNPTALFRLAYLDAEDGVDLEQAFAFAQDARVKLPNDPDVLDTIGLIYVKRNLTDEGMRLLKDLVARVPGRATFHLHFAMALLQDGNSVQAKKELDAALQNKPTVRERSEIVQLMARIG